jgi:hypothetical protein
MDPIDFDKATEEQKRYASTPLGAFVIIAIMVGGFLIAVLSRAI